MSANWLRECGTWLIPSWTRVPSLYQDKTTRPFKILIAH
jgi:hypothetical protein